MGALLARITRLFLRGDFEVYRVKRIWNEIVRHDDKFFLRVFKGMFERNPQMVPIFMSPENTSTTAEQAYVLTKLANNLFGFFDTLIAQGTIDDKTEFMRVCRECGERHAAYSQDTFRVRQYSSIAYRVTVE
jgi:hypothetical protein